MKKRTTGFTRKPVTDEGFNHIKTLQNVGLTPTQIKGITGYSTQVINNVRRVETVEEYREYKRKMKAEYMERHPEKAYKSVKPVAETKEEEPAVNTPQTNGDILVAIAQRNVELFEKSLELATRQTQALERMADAWESAPKRRLF